MEKIRFGIVGCGRIGARHADVISAHPDAELVALADIRTKPELDTGTGDVPFFGSISDLLDSGIETDVVSICTPNGLHAEHCILALEKGRHVVCEKPMGLTKESCEEVISKALHMSRQVFVVMQNRYSAPSRWLKEIVKDKVIGDIYLVDLNCYWNRDDRYYKKGSWKGSRELDGGTLFTQFSHFVDVMYWLFGDITEIDGKFDDFRHGESTEFEDSGIVNFRFNKGGMGSLNYSTAVWDRNMESSMTIIGSKGSVKVGGQYMDNVEYCHIKGYEMPELEKYSLPEGVGMPKTPETNYRFLIDNVIQTLGNKNMATTNALEGLKVVEIIERIYAVRDKKYV